MRLLYGIGISDDLKNLLFTRGVVVKEVTDLNTVLPGETICVADTHLSHFYELANTFAFKYNKCWPDCRLLVSAGDSVTPADCALYFGEEEPIEMENIEALVSLSRIMSHVEAWQYQLT